MLFCFTQYNGIINFNILPPVAINSLIIEDDIWPPDVIGRDMEHLHSSVHFRPPGQLVVIPRLMTNADVNLVRAGPLGKARTNYDHNQITTISSSLSAVS